MWVAIACAEFLEQPAGFRVVLALLRKLPHEFKKQPLDGLQTLAPRLPLNHRRKPGKTCRRGPDAGRATATVGFEPYFFCRLGRTGLTLGGIRLCSSSHSSESTCDMNRLR